MCVDITQKENQNTNIKVSLKLNRLGLEKVRESY